MADESIHELTAAYALHALDESDEAEYEAHLGGCDACRADLASCSETSASLASVVEGPSPPPGLRERILERATAARDNVVPLRRRTAFQAVAAVAAAAACLAVGLGVWAATLHHRLGNEQNLTASQATVLEIATDPAAREVSFAGGHGSLLVAPDGQAAIVLRKVPPAPAGHTYEAWVIRDHNLEPAGLFGRHTMLALIRPVPPGAAVAITVERSSGAKKPSRAPIMEAQA